MLGVGQNWSEKLGKKIEIIVQQKIGLVFSCNLKHIIFKEVSVNQVYERHKTALLFKVAYP